MKKQKAAAEIASKVERDAREWIETVTNDLVYVDASESKSPVDRRPVREVLLDDAVPIGATSRSSSRNAVDWVTDPDFKAASGRRVIRQEFGSAYNDDFEFKLRPIIIPQDAVFEVAVRIDVNEVPTTIGFGPINGKT